MSDKFSPKAPKGGVLGDSIQGVAKKIKSKAEKQRVDVVEGKSMEGHRAPSDKTETSDSSPSSSRTIHSTTDSGETGSVDTSIQRVPEASDSAGAPDRSPAGSGGLSGTGGAGGSDGSGGGKRGSNPDNMSKEERALIDQAAHAAYDQLMLQYDEYESEFVPGFEALRIAAESAMRHANLNMTMVPAWLTQMEFAANEFCRSRIRQLDIKMIEARQIEKYLQMGGIDHRFFGRLLSSVVVPENDAFTLKISKIVEASKYQGFDPSVIIKKMFRSWVIGRGKPLMTYQLTYSQNGEEERWEFTNKMALTEDLFFLITTFLNRGAIIGKMLRKSTKEFVAVMNMLVAKYGIHVSQEGSSRRRLESLSPDVITLPRIAAWQVIDDASCH